MKESEMDQIFKNKLEGYDSGASDALWAAIEAKRKKERRVVPWMYWLGGAALLLATGTLIWNLYLNSQESLIVEKTSSIPISITSEDASPKEIEQIIPIAESKEEKEVEEPIRNTSSVSTIIEKEAIPNTLIFKEEERVVEKFTPVVIEQEEEKTIEKQIEEITALPQLKAALLSMEEEKGPEGCYAFTGSRQPLLDALYFDGFAGLGYAFRNLENTSDPENDFYLTARDSTEREWYSFGAGLRASMRYESGLVLRAGVQFSQINEIFEITDGDATRTVTTEIRDAQGNVIGTETTVEQGELYKKSFNRLRMVDVPVMLGYEWTKDKLTFSANAGASFNLRFTQKGDVLSTKLESITIDSDNPNRLDYFKPKLDVSYIGSVGMTYELKDNLDLLIEPQVRYYSSSVGKHTLSQRYTDVGLFTGLRYYFMNRKRN